MDDDLISRRQLLKKLHSLPEWDQTPAGPEWLKLDDVFAAVECAPAVQLTKRHYCRDCEHFNGHREKRETAGGVKSAYKGTCDRFWCIGYDTPRSPFPSSAACRHFEQRTNK